MYRLIVSLILASAAASPAVAEDYCDRAPDEVFAEITGRWSGRPHLSLDNLTTSLMRRPATETVVLDLQDGEPTIASIFLDSLQGRSLRLDVATEPFDDEQIEEFLETSGNASVLAAIADRTCNAYVLPQLVAIVPETEGISAAGTVTLVVYDAETILQVDRMTVRSEEVVFDMVQTTDLSPQTP